ncbi:MAG: hypothetical protein H0U19_14160, partial [Acidobacteria bacterium]|nr:hypothetical protein [Acidobacteriota bacterium]
YFSAFYFAIGNGRTVFFRYVLPLVPLVCLFGAVGVCHAGEWIASRIGMSSRGAVATLALLVAAPSVVNSAWFDILLARTDTRVVARAWLASRLRPDSTLYDAGGYYATLDLSGLRFHPWYFQRDTGSFGHPQGENPHWLVLPDSPLLRYTQVAPEIRALAAREYVLVKVVRGTKTRVRFALYDQQDAFFMPVSGFSTVERPGPTIRIYRRRDLQ